MGTIIYLSPLYSQATDFSSLLPFTQIDDVLLPAETFTPDPEESIASDNECLVEMDSNTDATLMFSKYLQPGCTFIITSPPESVIPFSGNLDLTTAKFVRLRSGKDPLPLNSGLYQPLYKTNTLNTVAHHSSPPVIVRFKPVQQHSGFINILFSPENANNLRIIFRVSRGSFGSPFFDKQCRKLGVVEFNLNSSIF